MRRLPPELEGQLVEALVSIDWARDLSSISYRVAVRLCDCSLEQAEVIVQDLVERGLIERANNPGGLSRRKIKQSLLAGFPFGAVKVRLRDGVMSSRHSHKNRCTR